MTLLEQNKKRWEACKVYANKGPAFKSIADRITQNKAVYVDIENDLKKLGFTCPWWFIGMVHYRESNLNMDTNIANGQPFNKKTTIVPKGRGPFNSFKEAAIDALVECSPHAAKNKDWSAAGALTKFEEYNGLGYAAKGLPSPYVWSGTDQYESGKYVADHVFDPNVVDSQMGGAGILKFLNIFPKVGGVGVGSVIAAGTAATVAASPSLWDKFADHWVLYAIGAAVIAVVVDVIIYKIRNRKTTDV